MMDDWLTSDARRRFMAENRLAFGVGLNRPTSHVLITGIETMTPQQIMEELREKDPVAYARLSEIAVIEDGKMTEESIALLMAAIEAATS